MQQINTGESFIRPLPQPQRIDRSSSASTDPSALAHSAVALRWLCIPAAIYLADYGVRRIVNWRASPGLLWDAEVVWRAAWSPTPYQRPAGDLRLYPYLYPPWIVKLLPHITVDHWVYISAIALLAIASWLLIYRIESRHFPSAYPRWALFVIYNGPITAGGLGTALSGNYGFMLAGLYVWAIELLVRDRPMFFYAVVTLCALVKPQYLAFVVAPWILDGEVIGPALAIGVCAAAYGLQWATWPALFSQYRGAVLMQASLPVVDYGSAEIAREVLSGRSGYLLGAGSWMFCTFVVAVFSRRLVVEHRDEMDFVFAILIIASILCLPRFQSATPVAVLPTLFVGLRLLQGDMPKISLGMIALAALFLPWQALIGHYDLFYRVVSEQGIFWMLLLVWALSLVPRTAPDPLRSFARQ